MPSALAASADSRVLLRWNVQSSVPLFSLQLTEPQQRDDRDISKRGETKTDYSAVLPHCHSAVLCSELSLVRFASHTLSVKALCVGEFACVGKNRCMLPSTASRGQILLARESVSLAFGKVPELSKVTKKY